MFSSAMAERQIVSNDIRTVHGAYTLPLVLGTISEANQRLLGNETRRCSPSSNRLVSMVENFEARSHDLHGIQNQFLR
jgi:hypothetical protein